VNFLSLLLYAAANTGTPYPTGPILQAFGEICLQPVGNDEGGEKFEAWQRAAEHRGWERVDAPPASAPGSFEARQAYLAYHRLYALDYDLFASLLTVDEEMRRSVLHRRVAGRDVYLSLFTAASTESSNSISECRLHDPLGDGINANPITRAEVQRWLGRSVRQAGGPYRSTEYRWDLRNSIRVHFGFAGARALGDRGRRFDPYPPYGMTLVRSVSAFTVII